MARIEYPGSSGSNKLGALAGNYVPFPLFKWFASVCMYMEEVFTRRHKTTNIAGPDRLRSGRKLSPGLFIWPPYIFPSCTYGYLGGILVSITDFQSRKRLYNHKCLFICLSVCPSSNSPNNPSFILHLSIFILHH